MTELESLARLTSNEVIIEPMNPPRHGYFVCDQGVRPTPKIDDNHSPCVITRIWHENEVWIWEFPDKLRKLTGKELPDDNFRGLRALLSQGKL